MSVLHQVTSLSQNSFRRPKSGSYALICIAGSTDTFRLHRYSFVLGRCEIISGLEYPHCSLCCWTLVILNIINELSVCSGKDSLCNICSSKLPSARKCCPTLRLNGMARPETSFPLPLMLSLLFGNGLRPVLIPHIVDRISGGSASWYRPLWGMLLLVQHLVELAMAWIRLSAWV